MDKLKKIICVLLCFSYTFLFFGCGRDVQEADSYFIKGSDEQVDVLINDGDESVYHDSTARKDLTLITKSGMSSLCFSEASCSVSVFDAAAGRLWRSLPMVNEGEKAAVISLDLIIDGKEYTLNSQRDSMAMACTSYELKDDGVAVTYGFRRTFSDGTKIDIDVPVEFKAADGTLNVNIDCSAVADKVNGDKVVIRSISVLPYFGADREEKKGNYIILPDGCGLMLDTSGHRKEEEIFTVDTYSADPSLNENSEEGASGVLPVFGMKSIKGAFVAVINEGDAISEIKAHRASETSGYNRVFAEFELTPVIETEKGYYASVESYKGNINLSYRFIPEASSSYIGLASVCRELLTGNGSLADSENVTDGSYPFNLGIVCENNGDVYTDFEGSYDIISSLNSKGINTINLRLIGALEDNEIKRSLDNDGSYDEFVKLVSSKGIRVFTDAELLTDSEADNIALDIRGNAAKVQTDSFRAEEKELTGASAVSGRMNGMLYNFLSDEFLGICLNDAGRFLYSDFSKGEVVLRQQMSDLLYDEINAASATKEIMVSGGNLYTLKYADTVVELADSSFYGSTEGCTQVPFVQAVLHGTKEYSHSAINTAEDSVEAFLRSVEYGAVPYYRWHADSSDNESGYYYLNGVAQAKQQYDAARALFDDLGDKKITAHSKVAENVYLTVYGDSTEIYVNYGEKEATVSGVTVDGRSFIRIN